MHEYWHGLFNECYRHVRNVVHVKLETDHPHSVEMAFYMYLPNVLGSRFLGANQALALMLPAPPVLLYAHVSIACICTSTCTTLPALPTTLPSTILLHTQLTNTKHICVSGDQMAQDVGMV